MATRSSEAGRKAPGGGKRGDTAAPHGEQGLLKTVAKRLAPDGRRAKAIDRVCQDLDRRFGKGTVHCIGSGEVVDVPVIPTGSPSLDLALGVGGYPKGRIIEVYGQESSGKTTLALHAVAECQRGGGSCAFVDAEHALEPGYAANLGVAIDELLVSQPDSGEQALEITEALVRSGAVDLVVIDSVAALVPRAEIEGEMGDIHVGLQARLMSQALRKLGPAVHAAGATVFFINQTRHKIGVAFGSPITTPGGNALKFYASVRLDVRRIGTVKRGDDAVANRTRVKVAKNKVAAPFKVVEFEITYGLGINVVADLLDLGITHGVVDKSGAWFSMDGERLGQGREKVVEALRADSAKLEAFRTRVMAAAKAAAAAGVPTLVARRPASAEVA